MDFRVKKLILEEGMKNIAETEGVKLEMSFDSFTKFVTVDFMYGKGGLHKETSYDCVEREDADIFKTIEDTRREVQAMKNPTAISFMNGIHGGFHFHGNMDAIARAKEGINARYGYFSKSSRIPKIKNVIFNYPATIVFWEDGDKTVVKCQGDDIFDPEKGLAMAIVKKMNGGKGNYCEIFKPWIKSWNDRIAAAPWKKCETCKFEHASFMDEPCKGCGEQHKGYEPKETALEDILCKIDDLKKRLSIKSPSCIAGHKDVVEDIRDILEGKVDPLMIKTDEKPKLDKSCKTCKYECKSCMDEPCNTCIFASCLENVSPKWEPKE